MKFPKLVPPWMCKTPVTLTIYSEALDEDGAPVVLADLTLLCNYQDGGETVQTDDEHIIHITGKAYFDGDICPEIPNITGGKAVLFGANRYIYRGYKRRNPDGSVNHTEIQFK